MDLFLTDTKGRDISSQIKSSCFNDIKTYFLNNQSVLKIHSRHKVKDVSFKVILYTFKESKIMNAELDNKDNSKINIKGRVAFDAVIAQLCEPISQEILKC